MLHIVDFVILDRLIYKDLSSYEGNSERLKMLFQLLNLYLKRIFLD